MYKPKKAVAAVCAAAILLSPTGVLAASPSDFIDFPNDWSKGAMTAAVENGLLGGVSDGKIMPQGQLTRAQMAAIINRAFASEKTASLAGYTDVSSNAWYATDMAKAVNMGTFSGTGAGLLEPERNITREEVFSVLARAFALDAGDASALSKFSDGSEVSGWAAGSVAAMVEGGYVNGSDGNRLNPKQTITRAEFAAVMSNIVKEYIDAEDVQSGNAKTIDGNVIVRGDVDLSGYTINGDVIVADEADTVTLDNVTVTGRIVVRGASDKLTLKDSKADGVILTNPNGAVVLDSADSDLGTVTALSDLTVSGGSLDNLTVAEAGKVTVKDGAKVDTITVSSDDVTITGAGDVDTVKANADNVKVNVKGAEVTAGKGTTGVMAGDKAVAAGKTETVKDTDNGGTGGNTGGNTGGGTTGGGSTGGEVTPDPNPTPAAKLVNEAHTKLVDLGLSQYVAIQFTDGHNLKNSTITVDGTDVTSVCTPVSDDGSLVKWEITDLNPAELVVKSGDDTQTVKLSNNTKAEKPEVVKAEDSAPSYMVAHGPLSYWDYYLTNYDKDGKVRVEPSKTTFNLSGVETTNVPAFYSADAEIRDGETFGSVEGEVVIKFAQSSDADKEWFNAVADNAAKTVQLVSYNENKTTVNDNLTYTKGTETTQYGTNGTITIKLGQSNFNTNGRYYVRVKSAGHDTALVPIHVVNAKAPTLQLSGNGSAIQSGEDVSFTIKDMTYGITNPTYAAELTRPDGKTVSLTMINDWYQIGDLLKLYNTPNTDETDGDDNNIPYNGKYTLTIHSNGFKDMSCSFTVTGGKDVPQTAANAAAYDAVSMATSGGSTGGGSGEGGGGGAISADLKYNADLLVNAQVLNQLGISNTAAEGILNRWDTEMAGWDTVNTKDGTAYDFEDYFNKVNAAEDKGDYLTFDEYIETADEYTRGTPHSIKSVLEDNLLGDIQQNGSWIGMDVPAITLVDKNGDKIDVVYEGNDVILKAADADYFKALESVNVNNNSVNLSKDQYTVDGDTLTIKHDALELGQMNTVRLDAKGYKDSVLSIDYQRDIEQGLSLKADKTSYERGTDIVLTVDGSDGDFLKALQSVTVTKTNGTAYNVDEKGNNVYNSEATYTISDDNKKLTISDPDGKFFDKNGDYTINLYAEGYNTLSTKVGVTANGSETPGTNEKATPQPEKGYMEGSDYFIQFKDLNDRDWQNSVKVNVNGTDYKLGSGYLGLGSKEYKWGIGAYGSGLQLDAAAFSKQQNTVTLTADGYKTLTITVNQDGTIVDNGSGEQPSGDKDAPAAPTPTVNKDGSVLLSFADVDDTWQDKISAIKVNNTVYTEFDGIIGDLGENEYDWKDNGFGLNNLNLSSSAFKTGNNTVTISANGYKDMTVTVNVKDNTGGGTTDPDQPEVGTKDVPAYKVFDNDMFNMLGYKKIVFSENGENEETVTPYLNAITEVTVGGTTYSKVGSNGAIKDSNFAVTTGTMANIGLAKNGFSADGNTIITVKATGYKDFTLTVDKSGNIVENGSTGGGSGEGGNTGEGGETTEAKDAPAVSKTSKGYYGYVLAFNDINDDAWTNLMSNGKVTVTVNGTPYTKASYALLLEANQFVWSEFGTEGPELTLKDTAFTKDQNTIVIKADGYKDLTITVDKNGNIVESGGSGEEGGNTGGEGGGETTEAKTAPTMVEYSSAFGAGGNIVYFSKGENGDEAKAYLDKINKVVVKTDLNGSTEYTKGSVGSYDIESSTYFIKSDSTDKYIELATDQFAIMANTTIVISADGYKDLTITVDPYGDATADYGEEGGNTGGGDVTEGKDAPQPESAYKDSSNDITLSYPDLYQDSWKDSITITVNDVSYALTTDEYFGPYANEYKWVAGTYGGYDLKIDPSAFSKEQNTIVISADGYKDLIITVDANGGIVA